MFLKNAFDHTLNYFVIIWATRFIAPHIHSRYVTFSCRFLSWLLRIVWMRIFQAEEQTFPQVVQKLVTKKLLKELLEHFTHNSSRKLFVFFNTFMIIYEHLTRFFQYIALYICSSSTSLLKSTSSSTFFKITRVKILKTKEKCFSPVTQ